MPAASGHGRGKHDERNGDRGLSHGDPVDTTRAGLGKIARKRSRGRASPSTLSANAKARLHSAPAMNESVQIERPHGRNAFSFRERHVMRALAAALFDPEGRGDIDVRLEWAVDQSDAMAGAARGAPLFGLRVALVLLQFFPLLFGFGARRMTNLRVHDRVRYLEALEQAKIPWFGLPVFAWKTILAATYFEHPDALAETGYDGVCLTGEGSLTRGNRRPSRLPVVQPRETAA
jgi:hypothetical protein